jgi:hypothetical protein
LLKTLEYQGSFEQGATADIPGQHDDAGKMPGIAIVALTR